MPLPFYGDDQARLVQLLQCDFFEGEGPDGGHHERHRDLSRIRIRNLLRNRNPGLNGAP
jgi:hypothetical protein